MTACLSNVFQLDKFRPVKVIENQEPDNGIKTADLSFRQVLGKAFEYNDISYNVYLSTDAIELDETTENVTDRIFDKIRKEDDICIEYFDLLRELGTIDIPVVFHNTEFAGFLYCDDLYLLKIQKLKG